MYGFSEPLRNFFKFSELKVQIFLCTDWAKLTILGDLEYRSLNFKLYLFYNNNIQLQIALEVILLGG